MAYDRYTNDKQRAECRRRILQQYQLLKGCKDCGYDEHPAALEFDHLPQYEKKRTVASCVYNSWKFIWREVEKCEVVCANCHAIRTEERRNARMVER